MIESKSYIFPADAEKYYQTAKEEMDKIPFSEEMITEHFGIKWYEVCPAREAAPGYTPKKVLFLSPHSDDLEIAASVTTRDHIQKGDEVSELLITCGNPGRKLRGFTNKTMPKVREYEAYQAALMGKIQRFGVLFEKKKVMLDPDNVGLDEWFKGYVDGEYAKLGVSLLRKLNPHILYSPHPDIKVDKHPDHVLTANIASWAYEWGSEESFYADEFPPPEQINIEAWRRFAIWEGRAKLPMNFHTDYDPDGPFAQDKFNRIAIFQSQGGVNYAKTLLGRDEFIGGMITVGNDQHLAYEPFEEVRGAVSNMPVWQD